jgi:hypothetical protein
VTAFATWRFWLAFDQTDYLTGRSSKSARDTFFYYLGSVPSAVRWNNWKFYYAMSPHASEGWFMPHHVSLDRKSAASLT